MSRRSSARSDPGSLAAHPRRAGVGSAVDLLRRRSGGGGWTGVVGRSAVVGWRRRASVGWPVGRTAIRRVARGVGIRWVADAEWIRWVGRCGRDLLGAGPARRWWGRGAPGQPRMARRWGGPVEGRSGKQAVGPAGITDRDRLAVVDVDRRHPGTVDEDAVAASVDGHPMGTDEPQHHIRDASRSAGAQPVQRGCRTGCRSPQSRRGRGERRIVIDPTHTVNGEAWKSRCLGPHGRHLSGQTDRSVSDQY